METTLILGGQQYDAPDDDNNNDTVSQATGVKTKTASVGLLVWSDDDLATTQSMVQRYGTNKIDNLQSLLIPPTPAKQLEPLDAKTIAADLLFANQYPSGKRYLTEGWLGDERFWDCPDSTFEAMLEPLVQLYWANDGDDGDDRPPPAPSHTIVPLCPKHLQETQRDHPLVGGCTPSFNALSYAIYDNAAHDDKRVSTRTARGAGRRFAPTTRAGIIYTHIGEGRRLRGCCRAQDDAHHPLHRDGDDSSTNVSNLSSSKPIFSESAEDAIAASVALLDPKGLFTKQF